MKKNKEPSITKYTKETPKARKERASSGVSFRAVVFEDKKRKAELERVEKLKDDNDACQ